MRAIYTIARNFCGAEEYLSRGGEFLKNRDKLIEFVQFPRQHLSAYPEQEKKNLYVYKNLGREDEELIFN